MKSNPSTGGRGIYGGYNFSPGCVLTAGLSVVYDRLDTNLLRLVGNTGTSYQGRI